MVNQLKRVPPTLKLGMLQVIHLIIQLEQTICMLGENLVFTHGLILMEQPTLVFLGLINPMFSFLALVIPERWEHQEIGLKQDIQFVKMYTHHLGQTKIHLVVQQMLIRLAELYLNYAEALNESNPSHSDVLLYLNKVRTRAGLPELSPGLSQEEMREQIRHERRIEFCFEAGHRFFDVRRWKIADKLGSDQGGAFYGMNMNEGTELSSDAYHTRVLAFTRAQWQRRFYFFPYGQNEIDRNKELVQFPGY